MVAFKLHLTKGENITIQFREEEKLVLEVDKENVYTFEMENEFLVIHLGDAKLNMKDIENELDLNRYFFDKIEAAEPNRNKEAAASIMGTKCCNINGREYCVKNGCMDTPCGYLCG